MLTTRKASKRFKQLLESKSLKYTFERQRILEEVLQIGTHFDADQLHLILKERGLKISRDTVYRTLPLLLESGLVQMSVGDGRRDYFERMDLKGHHDHMICIRCGRVIEFHSPLIETIQQELGVKNDFELLFHDHRLFGNCSTCRRPAS